MNWTQALLAGLSFGAVPAAGALVIYRLPGRPAKVMSALLLAMVLWGISYSLELADGGLGGKVFWESARFVGVVAVPTLWLVFALQYTGRDGLLRRGVVAGLAVFPVLTLALVFTNATHGLMWSGARVVSDGSLEVLDLDRGPWFWVVVAYSYGLLLLGSGPVISSLLGHHRLYRMQSALLLLAALVPWAASGLNLLWVDRVPGLDLTPLGFPLSAGLLLIGVWRYRLLDISPMARDTATEGMGAAVVILDPKYRVVDMNPAAERIFGKSAVGAVGRPISETTRSSGIGFGSSGQSSLLERYGEEGEAQEEVTLGEGSERRTYNLVLSALRGERGRQGEHLMLLHDVTGRKVNEDHLDRLAHYDALTGLPNRRLFHDRLERAVAMARRRKRELAVLFLDLDGFKKINDTLGHDAGDALLEGVAARLTDCVRESDTVSRLAGDEFTVLLPEIAASADAVMVAGRILDAFSAPFDLGDREVSVSSSVGICLYPSGGRDTEALLKGADTAMYRAKTSGKNRFEFHEEALEVISGENGREDLASALQNESIKIHYQPVVVIQSGMTREVEALVRLNHRERGLLLPSEFLPAAETSGQIVPVGRSVLREACNQAKRWHELYPDAPFMSVCVNISIRELQTPTLHQYVADILRETGMEANHLMLEVNESSVLDGTRATLQALERLKSLGVRIALDDFGSGYAPLTLLKSLPLDVVKVSRSLLASLERESASRSMVAAVVSMAHDLELEVVGVGVENSRQFAHLTRLGCDLAQGHYLSRAVPADKIPEAVHLVDYYFNAQREHE